MNWHRKLLAPRNQPFLIYVLLLLALFVCALFYNGTIHRRHLVYVAALTRQALTDQTDVPRLKMERSSLEFELPSLRGHFPVLTNETQSRAWARAAAASFWDPDVRRTWQAWWEQARPLVLEQQPHLSAFVTIEEAYVADADALASDITVPDKPTAVDNLRKTKWASVFETASYQADRARFDETSGDAGAPALADLRRQYNIAVAAAVTRARADLAEYGRALLKVENRALEIRLRLSQLNADLASHGEIRNTPETPARQPVGPTVIERLLGADSPLAAAFRKSEFISVGLAALAFYLLITIPIELRDRRWLKGAVSAGLACLALLAIQVPLSLKLSERAMNVLPFLAYLIPALLLTLLWTPNLCFWSARLFSTLIDASEHREPDFSSLTPAYTALRRDDYREALRWIKPHLVHHDRQYEALVLKARLHRRLNQRWRAKASLKRALRLRRLADKQRQHVSDLLAHFDDTSHSGWLL